MNQVYSMETMGRPVAALDVDARATFISRTYTHLFGSLAVLTLMEVAYFQLGLAERLAIGLLNNWLLLLGAFMLVSWLGSRAALTAKSLPAQYAALGVYILFESLILLPLLYIAAQYTPPGTIGNAVIITLGGFAGLTAIAFMTRKDFTFLGALLRWAGICAIGLIACSFFFGMHLGTWFSVGMIALAGGAILHDTSAVLKHFPEDRFVGASLQLFASVALMFFYVLHLLISLNRE